MHAGIAQRSRYYSDSGSLGGGTWNILYGMRTRHGGFIFPQQEFLVDDAIA